jgi:hypothetical protein
VDFAHRVVISGEAGLIRYEHVVCARLGAWTVEDGVLSAVILEVVNAWWLSQPANTFQFVIPRPNGRTMERGITGLQIAGSALGAQLIPKVRPTNATHVSP